MDAPIESLFIRKQDGLLYSSTSFSESADIRRRNDGLFYRESYSECSVIDDENNIFYLQSVPFVTRILMLCHVAFPFSFVVNVYVF